MAYRITEDEYLDAENNSDGYCVVCKEFTRGCTEPDAEDYDCPVCGENAVKGTMTALMDEEFNFI